MIDHPEPFPKSDGWLAVIIVVIIALVVGSGIWGLHIFIGG